MSLQSWDIENSTWLGTCMPIFEKKSSRRLCYDALCLFPISQSTIRVVGGANKGCRDCWRPFSQYRSCEKVEVPILWDKIRIDEPLLGRKPFRSVSASDLVLKILWSGRTDLKDKSDRYLATGWGQRPMGGGGRGQWTIVSCNNGSI